MKTHFLKLLFISIFFMIVCGQAQAMIITKVKDKKVAIRLDGAEVKEGDMLTAYQDGKKRAFIRVTKVKGDKALGEILKGRAEAEMTLQPKGQAVSESKSSHSKHHTRSRSAKGSFSAGILAGIAMDSLSFKAGTSNPSLSGSGSEYGLNIDYNLNQTLGLRAIIGLNNFVVTGSSNGQTLNATVNFIEATGIFRYFITNGNFKFWAGLGASLFSASSSSNNFTTVFGLTLAASTAGAIDGSIGIDWQISNSLYVPVEVDYSYLLFSDSQWGMIPIRAGIMYTF